MRQGRKSAVRGALKSSPYRQQAVRVAVLLLLLLEVRRRQGPRQSRNHRPQHRHRLPLRPLVGQRIAPARQKASQQHPVVALPQLLQVPQQVRKAVLQLDRNPSRLPQRPAPVLRRNLRSDQSTKIRQNTTTITDPAMSPVASIPGVPARRGKSRILTRHRHLILPRVAVRSRQAAEV